MTKHELVAAVAKKSGLTQENISTALKALGEVTIDALNEDKKVKLISGVTITRSFREEHESRNPRTGETVTVPGKYVPRCKFTVNFKEAIK